MSGIIKYCLYACAIDTFVDHEFSSSIADSFLKSDFEYYKRRFREYKAKQFEILGSKLSLNENESSDSLKMLMKFNAKNIDFKAITNSSDLSQHIDLVKETYPSVFLIENSLNLTENQINKAIESLNGKIEKEKIKKDIINKETEEIAAELNTSKTGFLNLKSEYITSSEELNNKLNQLTNEREKLLSLIESQYENAKIINKELEESFDQSSILQVESIEKGFCGKKIKLPSFKRYNHSILKESYEKKDEILSLVLNDYTKSRANYQRILHSKFLLLNKINSINLVDDAIQEIATKSFIDAYNKEKDSFSNSQLSDEVYNSIKTQVDSMTKLTSELIHEKRLDLRNNSEFISSFYKSVNMNLLLNLKLLLNELNPKVDNSNFYNISMMRENKQVHNLIRERVDSMSKISFFFKDNFSLELNQILKNSNFDSNSDILKHWLEIRQKVFNQYFQNEIYKSESIYPLFIARIFSCMVSQRFIYNRLSNVNPEDSSFKKFLKKISSFDYYMLQGDFYKANNYIDLLDSFKSDRKLREDIEKLKKAIKDNTRNLAVIDLLYSQFKF